MAERRMFAKSIVLSDAFLDMPLSARCLYFTLGMLADDDGFVGSPKSIMRQCGASQDDMSILLQKRYVLGFESGVIVIKHWRMNNYLQNDRKKQTTYLDELSQLVIDQRGAYTEKSEIGLEQIECTPSEPVNNAMYTECIQNVYTGKDRLGKDRLGKDSIEIARAREEEPIALGIYGNVYLTKGELDELIKQYPKDYKDMIENLSSYMRSNGKIYADHFATLMRWKHQDENKAKAPPEKNDFWSEFDKLKEEFVNDEG